MIDFHCHILPEIDDGSQSMEESLELGRQSVASGVTHVLATPHASSDSIDTVLLERNRKIVEFQAALDAAGITLKILPGMEYFADGHSIDCAINKPDCLCGTSGEGRPMLVELPPAVEVSLTANLLFKAQLKGVPFVLAHPERYHSFVSHRDFFKDLLDKGIYLQFNSSSFKRSIFSFRRYDAIMALISYCPERILVGSDAHDTEHRPAGLTQAQNTITSALSEDIWQQISDKTPRKLRGLD